MKTKCVFCGEEISSDSGLYQFSNWIRDYTEHGRIFSISKQSQIKTTPTFFVNADFSIALRTNKPICPTCYEKLHNSFAVFRDCIDKNELPAVTSAVKCDECGVLTANIRLMHGNGEYHNICEDCGDPHLNEGWNYE